MTSPLPPGSSSEDIITRERIFLPGENLDLIYPTAAGYTIALRPRILPLPTLRAGKRLGPMHRGAYHQARLAMTRGEVKADGHECQQCAKGNGPWTTCVVLEGHFGGACANCQYPAQPGQCSLRKEKESEKRGREVAQSPEDETELSSSDEDPRPAKRARRISDKRDDSMTPRPSGRPSARNSDHNGNGYDSDISNSQTIQARQLRHRKRVSYQITFPSLSSPRPSSSPAKISTAKITSPRRRVHNISHAPVPVLSAPTEAPLPRPTSIITAKEHSSSSSSRRTFKAPKHINLTAHVSSIVDAKMPSAPRHSTSSLSSGSSTSTASSIPAVASPRRPRSSMLEPGQRPAVSRTTTATSAVFGGLTMGSGGGRAAMGSGERVGAARDLKVKERALAGLDRRMAGLFRKIAGVLEERAEVLERDI